MRNFEEDGKPKSYHMDGLAADFYITIPGVEPEDIYYKLKEAAFLLLGNNGGIGCYPFIFVHIDTRGTPAKWGCK